jgi:hypothetical protein
MSYLYFQGPMFRVWYKTIDKVFRNQKYAPAKMVLADQVKQLFTHYRFIWHTYTT